MMGLVNSSLEKTYDDIDAYEVYVFDIVFESSMQSLLVVQVYISIKWMLSNFGQLTKTFNNF